MAVRYRRQGLGRELTLGFGGEVTLGGLIDQSLPQSVPDPAALAQMRQARRHHPLLRRGMRTAEVWGDCVGVLQANVTALSLTSPLTMHSQRARTAGEPQLPPRSQAQSQSQQQQQQQQQRSLVEAKRAHPPGRVPVDANVDVELLQRRAWLQEEGLLDTWEASRTAGVATWWWRGSAARRGPAILHSLGRRLAYFSISAAGGGLRDASGLELWAAAPRRAGIAHFDLSDQGSCDETLRELQEAIEALKASVRVSFVVVSVCWGAGPIARGAIPTRMRAFCRALVDRAGADIVHGHGLPHFLGVEVYKGKPLLYSLGGLLSDRLHALRPRRDRALADALGDLLVRRGRSSAWTSFFARVVVRPTGDLGWVELHRSTAVCCRTTARRASRWSGRSRPAAASAIRRPRRPREGVRIRLSAKPPGAAASLPSSLRRAPPPRHPWRVPRRACARAGGRASQRAATATTTTMRTTTAKAGGGGCGPGGGGARGTGALGIGGGDDSGGLPSSLISSPQRRQLAPVRRWRFRRQRRRGSGGGDGGSGGGGSGGAAASRHDRRRPCTARVPGLGAAAAAPAAKAVTTPPQASCPRRRPQRGRRRRRLGLGLGLGSPSSRWRSSPRRSPGRSPGGSNWSPIGGGGGSDARCGAAGELRRVTPA